jgi:D-amino-acid dehydrogenase
MDGDTDSKAKGRLRSALVIGAGVIGVTTAYALARRGVAVTIIDKAAGPARGASFANGAQLSYCYTEALASPALLRHLPALALGLDPAFRLAPCFDPGALIWLIRFLRNSTIARFRANTLTGLTLGLESQLAMQALLNRHALEFGHQVAGKLLVYKDAKAFASACKMADIKRAHGAVQESLAPAEALRIEPALAARTEPFVGAIYAPQEALGDPHSFCEVLLRLLERDYGVTARLGTAVSRWEADSHSVSALTDSGERIAADQLILCAGIEARPYLKALGLGSALMPMKGYSFTAPPGTSAPTMSITDVSRKIVFCPLGGQIRVAGLAELGARNRRVDHKRVADLLANAADSLPLAANYGAANDGWAGFRPMTANSLPIIARTSQRVALNVGHGMLGWTYAMGSAERVARLMEEDI